MSVVLAAGIFLLGAADVRAAVDATPGPRGMGAPAPAVAGAPPPPVAEPLSPAEPDRPRLALVGAVSGENDGIAVFMDETTRDIVRLRTGKNHTGWVLRSLRGREATLEKGPETAILALPDPLSQPNGPGTPGMPGGKSEPEL